MLELNIPSPSAVQAMFREDGICHFQAIIQPPYLDQPCRASQYAVVCKGFLANGHQLAFPMVPAVVLVRTVVTEGPYFQLQYHFYCFILPDLFITTFSEL